MNTIYMSKKFISLYM